MILGTPDDGVQYAFMFDQRLTSEIVAIERKAIERIEQQLYPAVQKIVEARPPFRKPKAS